MPSKFENAKIMKLNYSPTSRITLFMLLNNYLTHHREKDVDGFYRGGEQK